MNIPYNKPYLTGKETEYITEAVYSGKISGNGNFTKKCHEFFKNNYGFKHCLLTNSCTDALEMIALLLELKERDEVIMPSYTFVSTANAFMLRGAKIKFADSLPDHPNIDPIQIEKLISPNTKAIIVVHYAGMACKMDEIMEIAKKHAIPVIEDAAQAIDTYYNGRALGSIGDMSTFSFHETKNIISGEGGMLVINNEKYKSRSEILWEKGTNRAAFFRGEVAKYNWVDLGSSFLPSEVTAAFLYAQLENLNDIENRRKEIWNLYNDSLKDIIETPNIPSGSGNNAHIFYIICKSLDERTALIQHLKGHGVLAVFHYLPLHESPFYLQSGDKSDLPNATKYANCLLRLPLFYELTDEQVLFICEKIKEFYS